MDSLAILKWQKLFTVSIKRDISRAVALPWFCPFKWRILPRHPFPSKVFNKNQSQTVCPFEKKRLLKKGNKREPSHEFAKRAVHNIVVHITFGVLVRFWWNRLQSKATLYLIFRNVSGSQKLTVRCVWIAKNHVSGSQICVWIAKREAPPKHFSVQKCVWIAKRVSKLWEGKGKVKVREREKNSK